MRPSYFDSDEFQTIYRLALQNVRLLVGIEWNPMDLEGMPEFDAHGIQAWIEEIALREAVHEYEITYGNPFVISPKEAQNG